MCIINSKREYFVSGNKVWVNQTPSPSATLSLRAIQLPTRGGAGPPAPVKNVFGLVWWLCRHTKPKTIESWRGFAPPVPVEGGKLPALPHGEAPPVPVEGGKLLAQPRQDRLQLWVMIRPQGEVRKEITIDLQEGGMPLKHTDRPLIDIEDHRKHSALIDALAGLRILVIGDVSLDAYIFGYATRLSREAPIPVLEWVEQTIILGGAANPARNIVALGSHTIQIGIVGDDPEGAQLRNALSQAGISPQGLLTIQGRPTTTKTRILAHEPPRLPQQVARIDRLDRRELDTADEERVVAQILAHIPHVDAVLCSDYQIGLLTPDVVHTIRTLCHQHGVLLTVDAQGNSHYYQGVDLFRCNNTEASVALGRTLHDEEDFRVGLEELQTRLQARLVIVTRGPEGLSLFGAGIGYAHLPAAHVSEVYDTTGAGDTFIAVVTLALASQLPPIIAAHLANVAAALVVRKLGNAVVTPQELTLALRNHQTC